MKSLLTLNWFNEQRDPKTFAQNETPYKPLANDNWFLCIADFLYDTCNHTVIEVHTD